MNLEFTKDKELIKQVLFELWDEIAPDGASKDSIDNSLDTSLESDLYLEVSTNSTIGKTTTGIIHFEYVNQDTYEIHMNMLKHFRGKYAKHAATTAIKLMRDLTGFKVLQAKVPDLFLNVKKFTENYGMREIGRYKNAWDKDGIKYDGTVYQMRYE